MRIFVDTQSLEQSRSGSVSGKLAAEITPADFFPDEGWIDFPVVVLFWWAEALLRLSRGQSEVERLSFMDGPYSIVLTKSNDCAFEASTEGMPNACTASVHLTDLAESVVKAAKLISAECARRGWSSDDLANLMESALLLSASLVPDRGTL